MKNYIEKLIRDYVINYANLFSVSTQWKEPLIAYADAKDPLFSDLKHIIDPEHFLPSDILEDAKTVITYFIPFHNAIGLGNVGNGNSSDAWATAYIETNKLINDLNTHISQQLEKFKYSTATLPPTHNFDKQKLISRWSHKHVAYIAGLGGFGLHQMLITSQGCSGRIGSVVTSLALEPTKRPKSEFCLFKHNGTCKLCINRCTSRALTVDSFDRHKCYKSCLENADFYKEKGLADVCGKCVSAVPCSFANPVRCL